MSSGDGMDAGRGAAPKRLRFASAFELPQRLDALQMVECSGRRPSGVRPNAPTRGFDR